MRSSAGASRMSSVRGLKARPQTATVLPFELAEVRRSIFGERGTVFWRSFTRSAALSELERRAASLRDREQRLHVLGEAAPP